MPNYSTPLGSEGLSRRVYPFLGIAVVGIATIHGLEPIGRSPLLLLGMAIGIALVLSPLADVRPPLRGRLAEAAPVVVGFVAAGYPLYANGSPVGILSAVLIGLCGTAPILLPWERVPRFLHSAAPIGGLIVAFVVEVTNRLPVAQSFPYVLLPVVFLALYYTTLEFVIGAALAVADVLGVALLVPGSGDAGIALVASLILVAFGILIRRVVIELENSNRELRHLTQLKSEFLSVLSHEIRTPLNGALGMTSLLLETNLTEDQREYIDSIHASGDALVKVLNDIVDFSAIEAGRVQLRMTEFDPARLVGEVVALYSEAAANKGIGLTASIKDGLPDRLLGDAGRLRQVLFNLVSNAVKFTDAGNVAVSAERWHSSGNAVAVRFEVTDTGVGLTQAEQSRVFAVYSQLDTSTTRRQGGLGVGLAISRMLVDMMGGDLGVESNKGRGSRFWFIARFREPQMDGEMQPSSQSERVGQAADQG